MKFLHASIFVAFSIVLLGGCAFTPKPVFIMDKAEFNQPAQKGALKVGLVVHDTRPEFYQNLRYFGKVKNGWGITTSFVFLANADTIDTLVAKHVQSVLNSTGFDASKTHPGPATRIESRLERPPVKDKTLSKTEPPAFDNPAKNPEWLKDCDAVVYIQISNCDTDLIQAFAFVEVHTEIDMNIQVKNTRNDDRAFYYKIIKGVGTSGPRPIITEECYNTSGNMSYWIAMAQLRDILRSDEFKLAVTQAAAEKPSAM